MKFRGYFLFFIIVLSFFSFTMNAYSNNPIKLTSINKKTKKKTKKERKPGKLDFNGYLSTTQSVLAIDSMDGNWILDNTIHNRLNFKYTHGAIDKSWVYNLEIRNRLVYGDSKKYVPGYNNRISMDKGLVKMSWNVFQGKSFLFNTAIERFSVTKNFKQLELTLGRQRINWGIGFAWNPNDLFNNASFFDFDYDEKPGCDAFRVQYHLNATSSLDFVAEKSRHNNPTFATMYKTNLLDYEIQAIGGYHNGEFLTLGAGFTGDFFGGALYGEGTRLQSLKHRSQSITMLLLGYSYVFQNELDIRGEFFYNKNKSADNYSFSDPINIKNLSPSKYNFMISGTYPITPLLKTTLSSVYYTDIGCFYISPSIDYSLSNNFSFTFSYQFMNPKSKLTNNLNETAKIRSLQNIVYLRLKWNF